MRLLAPLLPLLMVATALGQSAGGVKWTAPQAWKAQPDRPMRAATYSVPPAKGDNEAGEVAVFYFGPGQGGSVDANVKRWIGQFEQPDGKASADRVKTSKRTVSGLEVTSIDLAGIYTGGGGPMMAATTKKPGYRLLGAIISAPEGPVFLKFTGPEKTVAANEALFEALVKSVRK